MIVGPESFLIRYCAPPYLPGQVLAVSMQCQNGEMLIHDKVFFVGPGRLGLSVEDAAYA
jgi:hypothetical protein